MTPHPKVIEDLVEFVNIIGSSSDDAARVMRLHGLTEFFLERIICLRISGGATIIKDERFSYYHKLQIAIALGTIDTVTIGALRKLTKIRNRCAHERLPVITAADLVGIGSIFGEAFTKAVNDFEGENREFRALAWAIFTNLSRQVTPHEIASERLRVG